MNPNYPALKKLERSLEGRRLKVTGRNLRRLFIAHAGSLNGFAEQMYGSNNNRRNLLYWTSEQLIPNRETLQRFTDITGVEFYVGSKGEFIKMSPDLPQKMVEAKGYETIMAFVNAHPIPRQTLYSLMDGSNKPQTRTIKKIADILDCKIVLTEFANVEAPQSATLR